MDKPSVYTPLFRRLGGSERERELEETRKLYLSVSQCENRLKEPEVAIGQRVYAHFDGMSKPLRDALAYAMFDILSAEKYLAELPPPDFGRMNLQEFVEYRNLLYAKQYFYANQDALLELVHEGLVRCLFGLARELPESEDPSPFTIPLVYALPDPALMVESMYGTLLDDRYLSRGLFRPIAERLYENLCKVSGRDSEDSKKPWKHARESNFPLDVMVESYLGGTPFYDLFMTPVPLKLTLEDRMQHVMVCGGPGAGKTSLLQHLIMHDLKSPERPSIVVVEPHSDLVQALLHADLGIEDRIIYINPQDTPALNLFAIPRERHARYDAHTREQVRASVIQTFTFLFSALAGDTAQLTSKQQILFTYCADLLLTFPDVRGNNATILDLLDLLENGEKFMDVIEVMPPIPKSFFIKDFLPKNGQFRSTKEEVGYRLKGILASPVMARLLSSPETKVDLWHALNNGYVILVDTNKGYLKDGSAIFGRLFISLILQNLMERAVLPSGQRKDTVLIVDEASDYFSEHMDDLLTEVRKFRCSCVFAFQYLGQASVALRSSLLGATGIKFVSQVSAADARSFAAEMRTTPDYILDQPRLQFAAHIRGVTPQAVSIPVQAGPIRHIPKLAHHAYDGIIERNRARVSLTFPESKPFVAMAAETPEDQGPFDPHQGGQEFSRKW